MPTDFESEEFISMLIRVIDEDIDDAGGVKGWLIELPQSVVKALSRHYAITVAELLEDWKL